jgi:hypothetical protein
LRKILGLRFTNKGFAFAVVQGTKAEPALLEASIIGCPKAFKACEIAKWISQELDELFEKHKPTYIAIKAFEGRSKGLAHEERIRLEGIAHLSASKLGFKDVARKRNSTIAKDLGMKGRARYLKSFDTSAIDNFGDLAPQQQDAVLVAWSDL